MNHLVADLEVQVTGLGVETQVNTVTVVADDVLGSRILAVPPSHQLLESARQFGVNFSTFWNPAVHIYFIRKLGKALHSKGGKHFDLRILKRNTDVENLAR